MKFPSRLVFYASVIISISSFSSLFSKDITGGIEYISPFPNSEYNNIKTSIILRLTNPPQNLNSLSFNLTGTSRRNYVYDLKLADDSKTIIIKARTDFDYSDNINLSIPPILLSNGNYSEAYNLSFKTQKFRSGNGHDKELSPLGIPETDNLQFNSFNNYSDLPADFPPVNVSISNGETEGGIFISNLVFTNQSPYGNYLMILNNNGYPYYYKKLDFYGADFKMLDNGNFSYYKLNANYYEMDKNFNVVDSFYSANGYLTDIHEFRKLTDGSYFIISYDSEAVDMRNIIAGGNPNAVVTGGIVQKFDAHKNLVFQWRTWDGYEITDATHEALTAGLIDYAHVNAIEIMPDGNILVSSRHLDEITKINTRTGEIMWRLGGKHNQFKFINDDIGFSHQHDIRMLPNGNITLFDNGNFHSPHFSRAVEYKLDEVNKTIELVWQYRNDPDYYGLAMGSVQRLPNGNTLIGWGASNPSVTEVKPDGTKVLELTLPQGMFSYRAYKFDWNRYVSTSVPVNFSLAQNFPNPFNPSTRIRFDMPNSGHAKLFVTDAIGRQVVVLADDDLLTGTYEYSFNAGNLSSGVYFYTLSAGGKIETKRMMLVK